MRMVFEDGTTEEYADEPFADGGQGRLYLSKDKRHVVKLYHHEDRARLPVLHKILNDLNITKQDSTAKKLFAWINAIVKRPSIGVRMTNVNYELEHKQLSWWLGEKSQRRLSEDIRGNWFDRTFIASEMARIAWKLHGVGLCHSDFSGNNFLVNMKQHRAVLIDLDSLVVPDVLPPEILGTGDYMAPEIVSAYNRGEANIRPSIQTDLHALAVLIYQLLLLRHPLRGPKRHHEDSAKDEVLLLGEKALYTEDPNDRSNRPPDPFRGAWLLGEEVEALMRRAFTEGLKNPARRPLATEWSDALMRMTDQQIPCINPDCTGKVFVLLKDHPATCPWCGTRIQYPKAVPVFRLYSGVGQAGHYQLDRGRIVGWQQRTLHRWHTYTNIYERTAIRREDRQPVAEVRFDAKQGWILHNLGLPELRVANVGSMRKIGVGESEVLTDGQKWRFGNDDSSRLALVSIQNL